MNCAISIPTYFPAGLIFMDFMDPSRYSAVGYYLKMNCDCLTFDLPNSSFTLILPPSSALRNKREK
jgi:hypothetical protein